VFGPDRAGMTVVLAQDRIAFAGQGAPPRMAGARSVAIGEGSLHPGEVACVAAAGQEEEAIDADSLLASGFAAIIVALLGEDSALARGLALFTRFLHADIRLCVGYAGGSEEVSRTAELLRHRRSALHRVTAFLVPELGEADAADALDLGAETGVPVCSLPFVQPANVASRAFGRRIGELSEGAAGDLVVRDQGGAVTQVAVAGSIAWPKKRAPGFHPARGD
jgi:hypothetical protein